MVPRCSLEVCGVGARAVLRGEQLIFFALCQRPPEDLRSQVLDNLGCIKAVSLSVVTPAAQRARAPMASADDVAVEHRFGSVAAVCSASSSTQIEPMHPFARTRCQFRWQVQGVAGKVSSPGRSRTVLLYSNGVKVAVVGSGHRGIGAPASGVGGG